MPHCPSDADLAGFLDESLPGERLTVVSGHVDGCPLCQARLDRLTEGASGATRFKELADAMPDAPSGVVSSPEEATLILGGRAPVPALIGLPRVPGFQVAAEIGRGGMGVVYRARHRRLNRLVALKMILAGTAADPRVVQRFLFEGEVMARVQHPQVVQVYEVGTYDGPNRVPIPYLAMELLEGGSLSRRLREANDGSAPRWPDPRGAAELLEGVARAVHAAHLQGVVHRDLKPGNILFPSGTGARGEGQGASGTTGAVGSSGSLSRPSNPSPLAPKVMDFGLAKFTQESSIELTQTGQIVGTPHYMAPEQAAGGRQVGPAADVYALGAILFECLAGRPPFTGTEPMSVMLKVINETPPDLRSLRPEVPRDLAAVTMKCLAKEPGRRYASAEALADDVRRFLDNRPTKARPVTNFERLWFSTKRNPMVAGLLATLAAVLVAGFVAIAVLWVRAEDRARTEAGLRQAAVGANARAETALDEARRREAQLVFRRACESCEDGRVAEGLELFVRAAELAEKTKDADLARVARVNITTWARDLPRPTRPLKHEFQPRLAVYHPDGQHLVSGGRGRELHLWHLPSGTRVRTYNPAPSASNLVFAGTPNGPVYWCLAVSPDGGTIAAGGSDATVTFWKTGLDQPPPKDLQVDHAHAFPLDDDPEVKRLQDGDVNVWAMAFTSDTMLWTNDGANGLRRWDLTNPRNPVRTRFVPGNQATDKSLQAFAVSPDRTLLYTGDRDGWVREWKADGTELRRWRTRGWVTDVAVSPDGARVAATGTDAVVRVIDLSLRGAREPLELSLEGAYGNGVAFAPKRPFVVASDGDGNVRFWHRDTGQPVGIPLRFSGEVTRTRFRPDSDEFAVPAGDSVHLCGLPDPPGDVLFAGRGLRVRGLDFSPTGDRLATADERTFDLFDMNTNSRLPLAFTPGNALTFRFDADPARSRVFRGTRKGVDWFALPDGTKLEPVASFGLGRVHRLETRPDMVVVMGETAVARYDPRTLKQLAIQPMLSLLPAGVTLNAIAVRPDGREVLVAHAERVTLLGGDALEPVGGWAVGDEVLDARYTPDGTKVLLGRRANVAELRDARSGTLVGAPMPHARAVTGVGIAPNGAVLLTGSRDGTARFWDAVTGLPLGNPLRHAKPVTHVAFAPNGDHVATGTDTGHITVWDVPPKPAVGTVEELRAKFGPKE